jgi:squalene synthase HpnC
MGQARSENFPVASRLLPRRLRAELLAVYGFARLVDDLGDESPGDRLRHLEWLESELEAAVRGEATHPLLRRLTPTIHRHQIPPQLFLRLIEANRQDQAVRAYPTFPDLLSYCELSANPVGRLVLHVFGAATPDRLERSDSICTALQLAEHWQDVAEDFAAGRVYLPQEDLDRFGVKLEDLAAPRASIPFRNLMAFEVERTLHLLDRGEPLVGTLKGRPALAVAAFVAGGRAALGAIERAGHDVLGGPPRASRPRRGWELLRVLARRGVRPRSRGD